MRPSIPYAGPVLIFFRKRLKTSLFNRSFAQIRCSARAFCHFGQNKYSRCFHLLT